MSLDKTFIHRLVSFIAFWSWICHLDLQPFGVHWSSVSGENSCNVFIKKLFLLDRRKKYINILDDMGVSNYQEILIWKWTNLYFVQSDFNSYFLVLSAYGPLTARFVVDLLFLLKNHQLAKNAVVTTNIAYCHCSYCTACQFRPSVRVTCNFFMTKAHLLRYILISIFCWQNVCIVVNVTHPGK